MGENFEPNKMEITDNIEEALSYAKTKEEYAYDMHKYQSMAKFLDTYKAAPTENKELFEQNYQEFL